MKNYSLNLVKLDGSLKLVFFLILILDFAYSAHGTHLNVYGDHNANTSITASNVPPTWPYWVNLTNLEMYFKQNLTTTDSIRFQINNHNGLRYIRYSLYGANETSGVVSGNNITYPNVFNYTNITYVVTPNELAKEILIWNESAPTNFTFKFEVSQVNYTQESDTSITFYDNATGERVWAMKAPTGYDSSQDADNQPREIKLYYLLRTNASGSYIDLVINETNMSSFTYPLYIDPSVGACGTISSSGVYTLNASIYTTSTCFTISASNVVLNGDGYSITGDRGTNDNGISISNRMNVTVENLTIQSFYNGIILTTVNNSIFFNLSVLNNSFRGFSLTTNATLNNFTNITSSGNAQHGFMVSRSSFNNFDRIVTHSNLMRGFLFTTNSPKNNVTNSTIYNNTIGILFYQNSSGDVARNSTIYNNSHNGIKSDNSSDGRISNSIFYDNQFYAINLSFYSYGWNLENNTIYNSTIAGIYLELSNSTRVFNNTVYNNSNAGIDINQSNFVTVIQNNLTSQYYGLRMISSSDTSLSYNIAKNNSYGFYLSGGTRLNLSENNATNSTYVHYQFDSGSNVTFNGVNRGFGTQINGFEINISGNSNVTTLVNSVYYNFSTEHDSIIFDNAINVSMKAMDRSECGASLSGCNASSSQCNLLSQGEHLWNITNNSGSATINLGMFYNLSLGASEEYIKIGKHTDEGYVEVGKSSISTTNGYALYGPITSFSHFAVLSFEPIVHVETVSSVEQPKKAIAGLYNETDAIGATSGIIQCPNNIVEVKVEPAVENFKVELILDAPYEGLRQLAYTGEDGEAEFDLTNEKEGAYRIRYTKVGYVALEDEYFDFVRCPVRNESIETGIVDSLDTEEAVEKLSYGGNQVTELFNDSEDIGNSSDQNAGNGEQQARFVN
ncbi:right-handed parallel beta-helix repeat-containing protein, partial [Candidatus Micrarchaeota archaeon]|nr:right-handed parallel beta-helix repeat-containing protein [Candidatus Micrarchaeota archaeon]